MQTVLAVYRPRTFSVPGFFLFGYAHALAPLVVAYAPQGGADPGRILSPNRTHKTSLAGKVRLVGMRLLTDDWYLIL